MDETAVINALNILGNKFDSLSQIMELDIAQKEAINFNELIIAQLALLASLLMLIGDMLILLSQLKQNEQTLKEEKKLEEYDFAETLSMWVYVLGDYLCLESSLLELKDLKQSSQDE
ncbi:hypothetical protein [Clostridium cellulovorans]|uniref:Uncharacterized protein n=1 Tax=Clostridium cellulovorans (strain ATCC 35296 / DSM 3052 / OCM 3 / 743B) TaxID=573061 RepID=D9SPH6_CLOC7|nr:hypothetical protein [Clostridium cellulovorans]ADL50025.1 hypothetical protein Clocel_0241 [Clostridium cellulovorans 743B]